MKKRQVVVKTDQEGGRRSGGESRVVICYEDCLKNHAVSIRGYAVDGCKEFMASGAEGTANALICAVCRCHRNFHRKKEIAAEVNPTYEKYLKKKIDTYDEMATVVGKDVARGSGAKSLDDVEIQSHGTTNLEEKGEGELVKENDKQSTSSAQLESRKSQNHNDDSEFQNISTQMAEVAAALQKISKSKLDVDFLYQEVMKTEGFQEDFLGSALDHLVEHKNLAKGFLAKSDKLRRIWLEKFKENN